MTKKEMEKFKKLLTVKRDEMIEEMEYIKKSDMDVTLKDAAGDHSAYTFHMADQGTDNMEREKSFFYAQRDGRYLYHLDMALEKIDNGTYGKCESCGKEIDKKRLEAVPHARFCYECKIEEKKHS